MRISGCLWTLGMQLSLYMQRTVETDMIESWLNPAMDDPELEGLRPDQILQHLQAMAKDLQGFVLRAYSNDESAEGSSKKSIEGVDGKWYTSITNIQSQVNYKSPKEMVEGLEYVLQYLNPDASSNVFTDATLRANQIMRAIHHVASQNVSGEDDILNRTIVDRCGKIERALAKLSSKQPMDA